MQIMNPTNFDSLTFPQRVLYLRKSLGLSQRAFAKLMDTSYAAICRWEKGNRAPRGDTLNKFYKLCRENGIVFTDFPDCYCLDTKKTSPSKKISR